MQVKARARARAKIEKMRNKELNNQYKKLFQNQSHQEVLNWVGIIKIVTKKSQMIINIQ